MGNWEANIRKVVPYVPGEQPKEQDILYPDPAATKLVDAIAEYHGVDKNQVFVGVGSDDVLAMSFMTFFNSGKPIFFPDITYSFYDVWADMLRIPYETKPLDADFRIKASDYYGSRSMAGLRIGYALGNEKLIGYLNDVKYSYNSYTMDLTSIELGTCSIKADDYFKEMVKKVVDTRTWFVKEIEALGFTVLPSSANFVFATHKTIPAKEIFEKAREHKIFVRYFDKPRIDNYLRISIGTDKEMQLFVAFLKTLL